MQTELITQTIITAIVTSLVSFLFTPFSMLLARRLRVIDNPQAHKLHQRSTPVMGGVAMWLAFVIGLLIFGRGEEPLQLAAIVGGGTLIACVGLIDDRYNLNPALKLLGQVFAALILVFGNVSTNLFPDFAILNSIITVMWVLAIVNALNLQDNIDGLAGGIAATAALSFLVLAILHNQFLIAILSATLLGACAGFLTYNFQPAVTFMGDTGSLLLGFILAILGLKISFPSISQAQSWLVPILVLGLPIFDTLLVMISRTRRQIPIWRGGTDHTSHRLVRLGLSHRRTVLTLYFVSLSLGVLAILVANATTLLVAWWTLGVLVIAAMGLIILLELALISTEGDLSKSLRVLFIPGSEASDSVLDDILSLTNQVTVLLNSDLQEANQTIATSQVNDLIATASLDPATISAVMSLRHELPSTIKDRIHWANKNLKLRAKFVDSSELTSPKAPEVFIRQHDLIILSGGYETNVLPVLNNIDLVTAITKTNMSIVDLNSNKQDVAFLQTTGLEEHLLITKTLGDTDIAKTIQTAWIARHNKRRNHLLA